MDRQTIHVERVSCYRILLETNLSSRICLGVRIFIPSKEVNIDLVPSRKSNLNLNSKIPNTVYRKDEVKWIIEINNNNMEITENGTENRNDYESGRIIMNNYELKNDCRKYQNESKKSLNLRMLKLAGTFERFNVCQDNNVCLGVHLNDTKNVVSTYTSSI